MGRSIPYIMENKKCLIFTELDDRTILTGKSDIVDGKNNHGFPLKIFPTKPIH